MPTARAFVLLLLGAIPVLSNGQLVQKKSLLIHLGGGVSLMGLSSELEQLSASGLGGGAIELSFAYAFSPRWSLGFHYQRLGTDRYTDDIDRLRLTRYEIEGSLRVVNEEKQAVELALGIGAGLIALHDRSQRLPVEALTQSFSVGARYIRLLSKTVGAYAGVNASPGGNGELSFGDEPVHDANGEVIVLDWNSISAVAGVAVRF